MKHLMTLAAAMVLVGCESTLDVQRTWIGSTDTELLSSLGAPDLTASDGKGGRVFTYVTRWNRRECRSNYSVEKGRVVYVSNDCPS